MADQPEQQAADEAQTPQQQFAIQKVYLKDVSLETPNSPSIFTMTGEPAMNVDLNTQSEALHEGVYEVVLGVTATVKIQESTAFLVEVHQAGVFNAQGFNEQELGQVLGAVCPNILFPFAREAVADLVNKGGFPQLVLQPVNFDLLYMQEMQRRQEEAQH